MVALAWVVLVVGVGIAVGALLDVGNDPVSALIGVGFGVALVVWARREIQQHRAEKAGGSAE